MEDLIGFLGLFGNCRAYRGGVPVTIRSVYSYIRKCKHKYTLYRRLLGGGEKGLNARSNPNKGEDSPELARTRLVFFS